jgi:hypothetical protein
MSRRAWIDGPSANKSFMAEVSYQFVKRAAKAKITPMP